MDRLFGEGASGRRRFLDRLVYGVDPAHAGRLTAYEHALRERGRLLKEAGADGKWLDAVEDVLVHKGVAVAAARRDMVGRLIRVCLAAAGPFPVPGLALEGEVENWLAAGPALEAEERMRRRLAEDRHQDAEHGVTSVGPHRSDLVVRHLGHGVPARDCSTGEQKALLVSIILAQARVVAETRGMAPLVLLDEVAAHLDARRRAALFDAVSAVGAQAWMTGTDLSLFADLGERAQYFEIRDATATRLPI
jgi:DNA replication and repair protein RecF